jgi:hypothetical protein
VVIGTYPVPRDGHSEIWNTDGLAQEHRGPVTHVESSSEWFGAVKRNKGREDANLSVGA